MKSILMFFEDKMYEVIRKRGNWPIIYYIYICICPWFTENEFLTYLLRLIVNAIPTFNMVRKYFVGDWKKCYSFYFSKKDMITYIVKIKHKKCYTFKKIGISIGINSSILHKNSIFKVCLIKKLKNNWNTTNSYEGLKRKMSDFVSFSPFLFYFIIFHKKCLTRPFEIFDQIIHLFF